MGRKLASISQIGSLSVVGIGRVATDLSPFGHTSHLVELVATTNQSREISVLGDLLLPCFSISAETTAVWETSSVF